MFIARALLRGRGRVWFRGGGEAVYVWGLRSSGLGSLIKSLHKQNTSEPKKRKVRAAEEKKKGFALLAQVFLSVVVLCP